MSEGFGFVNLSGLLWLLLVPPAVAGFWFAEGLRLRRLGALGRRERRRAAAIFVPGAIILAFVVAYSRPYYGMTEIEIARRSRDVIALVDVSKSMLVQDLKPNRLEVAKRKLFDLIQIMASQTGDRLGLILFAGDAYLFCPLTGDYAVLRQFVRDISDQLIVSGGSAIGDAVEIATESFDTVRAERPMLFLLSDGEDQGLDLGAVLSRLKDRGVVVSALGLGTTEGGSIEQRSGLLRDQRGNIVVSKLDEETLKKLTAETGGVYVRAGLGDADLRQVLGALPTDTEATGTTRIRSYGEIGPGIAFAALLTGLILLALGRREVLLVWLALLLVPAGSKAEQTVPKTPYAAYQAYLQGALEDSVAGFSEAVKERPDDADLHQALGAAQFRNENYDEAAVEFRRSAELALTGKQQFEALYNLGNAQLKSEQYKPAIDSYQEALKIKADDEAAEFNLQLARKLLEKQQEQQQQQQEQKKEQEQQSQQEQKQGQEPQDGEAEGDEKSPQPNASPSAEPTAEPGEGSQPESDRGDQEQPQPADGASGSSGESPSPTPGAAADSEPQQQDSKKLSKSEAEVWLDSLSDFPLLLRRQTGRRSQSSTGQGW